MSKIKQIYSWDILDSRGVPTVETAVVLDSGSIGVASAPSGASTGSHEALELRDGDDSKYHGQGVGKAVANVNNIIAKKIVGMEAEDQQKVDQSIVELDGTPNKSQLGANAILTVSIATCKAIASERKLPLYKHIAQIFDNQNSLKVPTPIFNFINGGLHGAGNLDFQEFHVIPATNLLYSQALEKGVEVYHTLKRLLARRGAIYSVGDEGGFAPNLFTNLDALEIISEAISQTGFAIGRDINLGLDVAANHFFKDGKYFIKDRSSPMGPDEFIDYYRDLNKQYRLTLLEDPLYEDDWGNWRKLTEELAGTTSVVGDDLLVTNPIRVKTAIKEKSCNVLLVKPNQIGTVSETIEVTKLARSANWKIVVSHRSGETNDTFIADFAVGVGADYTKFGGPSRGERVAKYNRLKAIEIELKSAS
jgi:enolase